MSITITAENVSDARSKLGSDGPYSPIKIRMRKGEPFEYMNGLEPGCIIDATGMPGQEVARSFKSATEALRYLRSLLMFVDAEARKQKKESLKKKRQDAKSTRARARGKQ